MIIKLTSAGKNETIFVNFAYVRTMRRDGTFTELVMSDDKYHKLAVLETPEEIYDMLYPHKSCTVSCGSSTEDIAANTSTSLSDMTLEMTAVKKPAAKKTAAKTVEDV